MASNGIASSEVQGLDASRLVFKRNAHPKALPNIEEIASMNATTDHMITCSWTASSGWQAPHLHAYGPLSLMPTASALHYATECFEGLKCYRGYDGRLRLFRPDRNCERMLNSARRISLPDFEPKELQKLIEALVSVDGEKWLPKSKPGTFLYVRPTMIGTEPGISVRKPHEAVLYIVALQFPVLDEPQTAPIYNPSPSGHVKTGRPGMKLLASRDDMVRAWPGGFGSAKVGANYGPSFNAQAEAKERGYDQVLWLLGRQNEVTEAGASNFFVIWKTREGVTQLVTAPLSDGIILDGVTRGSVLELARRRLSRPTEGVDALQVLERKFNMDELPEAVEEGRMVEAFAAGTAFFVSPVSHIHYRGKNLDIPMSKGTSGVYASFFKDWLRAIMYGKERHEWGFVVEEHSDRT